MRRTLVLIISLLAASATMTAAATAHDYHRSRHAVEKSHGGQPDKARHHNSRHHKAKHHRLGKRHCRTHRGHRRYCPPRRHAHRQIADRQIAHRQITHRQITGASIWPPFVIVISPDGNFRVARRYR